MQTLNQPKDIMDKERIFAVDYTKALAIFWVIVIHVSSDILLRGEIGGRMWLEGLFWGSLARGAVPMFLMCSGVLFLDKKDGLSIRHVWKRNLPHILIALLVWAAIYKAVPLLLKGTVTAADVRESLRELLCGQHEGHLYFLHMMLLIYAALPITYTFAVNADEKIMRYALVFWVIFGSLLPALKSLGLFRAFSGIFQQWPLPLAWGAIGCTLLGYFLIKHKPIPAALAVGMIVFGFAVCFAGTWILSARTGKLSAQLLEGLSPGPCMMAAGFFSLSMRISEKASRGMNLLARHLSSGSFCVYLVHMLVLRGLRHFGASAGAFEPIASVPLTALLVWTISQLFYFVCRRIPWVRRWVI